MLEVDVAHRMGSFALDARFTSGPGLTAFFGRSGSGKTTLVNVIGGLIRPERGRVHLGHATLVDTDHRIFVPKHRRRIGYVFQEPRLFPHLTVRQNLLFGRWFAPQKERSRDWAAVVDLLGIGHLLTRSPAGLSGGEKQRVAIGRALLSAPQLLLMDEPLASLDEERKTEILPYIERLRDETGVPIVYVSHSVAETARLATTVVVLENGRTVRAGPPGEIFGRHDLVPAEAADEVGALLEAVVVGHDAADGVTSLRTKAGLLRAPRLDLPPGSAVRVRVRARDVMVAVRPPDGLSALNVLPGRVGTIAEAGDHLVELQLDCGEARIPARLTRTSVRALDLRPGRDIFAVVKSVVLDRAALAPAPRVPPASPAAGASDA